MSKELNDEVDVGSGASKALAEHLMRMGASKTCSIEAVDDGKIKVTAEYLSSLKSAALLKKIDDINQVIALSKKIRGDFYEELSNQYREASEKLNHASDCAIHNAPAECPGPCDCNTAEIKTDDDVCKKIIEYQRAGQIYADRKKQQSFEKLTILTHGIITDVMAIQRREHRMRLGFIVVSVAFVALITSVLWP